MSVPCWPILAFAMVTRTNGVTWRTPGTRFQAVFPGRPPGSRPLLSRRTLLEKGLRPGIGLRLLRAQREAAITEHRQILAHRELALCARATPPRTVPRSAAEGPAAASVRPRPCARIGAGLNPACKIGYLVRAEPARPGRSLAVRKTCQALGIAAMDPVTQRLPVHPAGLRRRRSLDAVHNQSQRQHPPRCLRVPAPRRCAAQIHSRQIRPRDRHCHHRRASLPQRQ